MEGGGGVFCDKKSAKLLKVLIEEWGVCVCVREVGLPHIVLRGCFLWVFSGC